ncbi:hypothetical protein V6N13_018417 [Hibiscus sabdariffa]
MVRSSVTMSPISADDNPSLPSSEFRILSSLRRQCMTWNEVPAYDVDRKKILLVNKLMPGWRILIVIKQDISGTTTVRTPMYTVFFPDLNVKLTSIFTVLRNKKYTKPKPTAAPRAATLSSDVLIKE